MRKKLNLFMVIVLSLLMSGCVISGTITDEVGTAIEGVEVTIAGSEGNLTTQTNVDGNYAFGNLLPGNYTITPSSGEYTFTPAKVNANKATTRVHFEGEKDTCGDGIIDLGEECDDGAANENVYDKCQTDCSENHCEDVCLDNYSADTATCVLAKGVAEGVCQDEYDACSAGGESPGCDSAWFACMDDAEIGDVECHELAMDVRDECITTNCGL